MYIDEILWYMVFPATVVVGYYAVKFAIKKLDVPESSETGE